MRKLALALVPLILLRSTSVFALGVGDIELHSALNQPLNAEIRLLSATPAEIQGLTVTLAPDAAFINAGVDRLGLLSQLRFKVVQKPDGSHVIKVTSPQPIREPFLDFLVEVNWPNGRFIREYTVLLDFPVLEGGKPAPLDAPVTGSSSPSSPKPSETTEDEPTSAQDSNPTVDAEPAVDATNTEDAASATVEDPVQASDQTSETPPPSRKPARQTPQTATDGNYGPIQRADTLWDIALKMRPDSSVSVSQVMVALAKNNPQAFFSNNVNNLMAGYILRLPPVDQIRAIPKEAAVREIAGQYQQWLSVQRGGMAVPSAPDEGAAGETVEGASPPNKPSSGAQLKLTTPETAKTSAGKKSPTDTSDVAALRKELTMALEAVDANLQENTELRERMAQLEQQIASMQRLLALKDSNLAALQNNRQNAQQNKNAVNTPAPVTTDKPAATQPAPTPAVSPVESQETDLLGILLGNPKQLGLLLGGFLLISALVWGLVRWRRQSAIDSADASFAKLLQNSAVTPEGEAKKAEEAASSDSANTETSIEQELPTNVMALSSAQTDEDMIDPLAEADVYLAYKRYDQAAELMKDAIRNDPTRPDLSLKLLEIYHLGKNTDAFETQAETLYAELSGDSNHPLWAKAIEMGKQTAPTHPLFSRAVIAAATTDSATEDFMVNTPADAMDISTNMSEAIPEPILSADDSFTLDMPSQELPNVDEEATHTATNNSIEFDLHLPMAPAETSPVTEAAPPALLSNNMDMDFDLSVNDHINNVTTAINTEPDVTNYGNGHDTQAVPAEFSLDTPDIAAFDGTAFDETSPTADDELFSGLDIVGTKLDLAKAYIDMEDKEGARMLLNEVLAEGSPPQKNEAQELMRQIG